MKDAPFDLVFVKVFDAKTGKKIFITDQFIAISGIKKDEIGLTKAFETYRKRFGLEEMNRFEKQHMFMEGYQTQDLQLLDNWMLIIILSCWFLYVSAPDVENICQKWQKYSEPKQAAGRLKTISQVRKGVEKLFLNASAVRFCPPLFYPEIPKKEKVGKKENCKPKEKSIK